MVDKTRTFLCTNPQFGELVDHHIAGELPEHDKPTMMAHLDECQACKNSYDRSENVRKAMETWNVETAAVRHKPTPPRVKTWKLTEDEKVHVWECVLCQPHIPWKQKVARWGQQNQRSLCTAGGVLAFFALVIWFYIFMK